MMAWNGTRLSRPRCGLWVVAVMEDVGSAMHIPSTKFLEATQHQRQQYGRIDGPLSEHQSRLCLGCQSAFLVKTQALSLLRHRLRDP